MSPKEALRLRDCQQHFVDNLMAKNPDPHYAIYCNNWRFGLVKALANTYPVCQRLVGEQYFRAMVDAYLTQFPSCSPSLNDYGSHLADSLVDSHFVRDLPYLLDVMRLEWHVHCIFMGPDEDIFDWGVLSSVPADQYSDLIFCRPKNAALLYSPYPIDRIWETNQVDFICDDAVDLGQGAVYLFIRRSGFDISISRLTAAQWQILSALDGKRKLSELEAVLAVKVENQEVVQSLPGLIKAGYINNFV